MVALLHPEDMFSTSFPILCFWHAPCFPSMTVSEPWRDRIALFAIRSQNHRTQPGLKFKAQRHSKAVDLGCDLLSPSLCSDHFLQPKESFIQLDWIQSWPPVEEENGNNKHLKVMSVTKSSQILLLGRDWLLWKHHIHSFYSNHTLVMCVCLITYTRDHWKPGT